MSKPIISIVIAVFNGEGTLQKCIDSVVGQGYPDKELVIMDGGSTDKTIEILNANDKCIDYWESMADRGISHAWNKGLERTQGEWIIFLGADDFLADSHVLERACKYLILAKRENKYIAYGQVDLVNEKGILLERRGRPWVDTKRKFRTKRMAIPHQGCFCHRKIFMQYGKFDETFSVCADYEMLLRELKRGDAYFMPDVVITMMSAGGCSNSPRMQLATLHEEICALRKHGLFRLGPWVLIQIAALVFANAVFRFIGEKGERLLLDGYRVCVGKQRRWSV